MADRVDNYLGLRHLKEDEIGIGQCRHPANCWVVGSNADARMIREKINDKSQARMNLLSALGRMRGNKIQNGIKIGKGRSRVPNLYSRCFAQTACT